VAKGHLRYLQNNPNEVEAFFQKACVKYAA